jgi:BlaI family transcriptional regulator, penicillinase repressor
MKKIPLQQQWSRRERQIMDVLYEAQSATVAEVREAIPEPPSYSAVRALLRVLEEKGHVRHEQDGARYVYVPVKPRTQVANGVLQQVMQTFFGGSVEAVLTTLLNSSETKLTAEECERLTALIEQAKEEGR